MNNTPINANLAVQTIGSIGHKTDKEINKVAKEFEQMALSQLLSFANTDNDMSDSMFGGGAGERAFKPMLFDEYAKSFADMGGVGIANSVKAEILKIQEAAMKKAG